MKRLKINIKYLIYIFMVFYSGIYISAQINADSLELALKTASNSEKLTILNNLSSYYLVRSPGKAVESGYQAMNIANELKNLPGKIVALVNIGNAYLSMGDNNQSINYYKQALEAAKTSSLQKEIAFVSLKIGNYYNIRSVYVEALKYDLEALKIYKTLNDSVGLSDSYHYIGIVYYYLGSLDKGLEFSKNALEIRVKLNDKVGTSKSLNNIAMIYMNMNKNDLALEYYFKALKLMEETKAINDQAITLSNIGITYKQMNNNDQALIYYFKSLALYDQFTDNRNKSRLFVCMGIIYTDLKKYDKAESYLDQGLSLAKKSDYLDMIALNYMYFADLYLMMGNYKKTLDFKNLYFDIKDSVFTDSNRKIISEFQVRIETDNTQREAELIKEKSNILLLLFLFLALAVLIIIIVILYSRHRAKQNANLAHNKLNFHNYEANISIEKLIFWSNYQNGSYLFAPKDIKLAIEINNSIKQSNQFIESKKIIITSTTSEDTLVHVDAMALNLVTRYLIFNAIKHSSVGDQVTISSSSKGEFVEIAIAYSAMEVNLEEISGLFASNIQQIVSNKDKEPGENLSLALCKEFIEKSGGKIWVVALAENRVALMFTLPNKS